MIEINERGPECKFDVAHIDAEDLAILTLTRKFGLARSTARVLAHLAGLGGSGDRGTAGKAK